MVVKFTPTERRILKVLSDGQPHTRAELMKCLWDELASPAAMRQHIINIRPKIAPLGQTIVCEMGKSYVIYYRHVTILTPSANPLI